MPNNYRRLVNLEDSSSLFFEVLVLFGSELKGESGFYSDTCTLHRVLFLFPEGTYI